jgi:hypothetical protein
VPVKPYDPLMFGSASALPMLNARIENANADMRCMKSLSKGFVEIRKVGRPPHLVRIA